MAERTTLYSPSFRDSTEYIRRALTTLVLAAVTLYAHDARADLFDDLFGNEEATWQEIAAQIPPPPEEANLMGKFIIRGNDFSNYVDSKSISIGTDGVVRYTLVSVSTSGARNISYEGIRCLKAESRHYAFLHADGTWGRAHNESWDKIIDANPTRQEFVLFREFMCDDKRAPKKVDDILHRLKGYSQGFVY